MFSRNKNNVEKIRTVGDDDTDAEIIKFEKYADSLKDITESVREYLMSVRGMTSASGKLTQSILGFYPPHAPCLGNYKDVHEYADNTIPQKLMEIANDAIVRELEAQYNNLVGVYDKLKILRDKIKNYNHYRTKVIKLEEEKRKRSEENKAEKPKQIEKLHRNMQKYHEAESDYAKTKVDMLESIRKLLYHQYEIMDPVIKKVVFFQQEFYKQIAAEMQKISTHPFSWDSVNVPAPVLGVAVAGLQQLPSALSGASANSLPRYDSGGGGSGKFDPRPVPTPPRRGTSSGEFSGAVPPPPGNASAYRSPPPVMPPSASRQAPPPPPPPPANMLRGGAPMPPPPTTAYDNHSPQGQQRYSGGYAPQVPPPPQPPQPPPPQQHLYRDSVESDDNDDYAV